MNKETVIRRVFKPGVFLLCLIPLAVIVERALFGGLGANPVEAVNRFLGDWALRILLVTLTITPLVHLGGWPVLVRFRRMVGLFAFFYAVLHVSNYVIADQFFNWGDIWADIVKRNYITVGMGVIIILTALAVTSPKAMIKKMGATRWRKLHRLAYIAGIGGVFHYWMMIKADLLLPQIHAAILAVLLGYRLYRSKIKTRSL
ncbi:MAG: sulfoxide reductase heme-binding subunit YedZ [Rhodospirillaceae bacterium]|jgi:methionine sulfoxide reductase heme-binding subunit|nr:sulfoxide reductase heme-binding subunit YedZ [Rhodospirillaceae bacterium]MBT4218502.1 sulfoxide reductase heme-binding subunit YedZ [Rhodospirillaceae bacterium]MBT4463641.1 sulfoxide reductase heme-binding subunit YedZ [Rhodospirillaceae bacterium]MBT5014097.1 sulfoxide reductase heme-binding subunit YedZ [Rhodospirillaceae bacterium]MBT5308378.1 sulfoxide reductase heme-binding subunit YedZ [Rhodospirillaceae bacterium]